MAENFFGVKIDTRTNERLLKILRFKHNAIYFALSPKNDFKYYGYLGKDDIWLSFLLDEIDKKTFNYYKK